MSRKLGYFEKRYLEKSGNFCKKNHESPEYLQYKAKVGRSLEVHHVAGHRFDWPLKNLYKGKAWSIEDINSICLFLFLLTMLVHLLNVISAV